MTKLRKWRFPVLIGSGIIAACGLVYFANGHIGTDKTQGAIGKRDVYRDAQVSSSDVATPGSAPVATSAIDSLNKNGLKDNGLTDGLKGHDDGLKGHDDGLKGHDNGLKGHDNGLIKE